VRLRVLLDACIAKVAAEELRAGGHDVAHMAVVDPDPGDDAILERARVEDRVLVTLDRDFGHLAVVRGVPHRGIVRLTGLRANQQGSAATMVLETYADELALGAIVTVEPGRVRVRPGSTPRET